jgi:hypothetical protein
VAPALTNARITPDILYAGDTPTCEGSGWTSADGHDDPSEVEWFVNGQLVGVYPTLDAPIRGGDTVTCQVTPFDGEHSGTSVSTTILVQNTEPSLLETHISPWGPGGLICQAIGFDDPDDDMDLTRVGWSRDGIAFGGLGSVGSAGVPFPGPVEAGHTYRCTAWPFDGEAEGEAVFSEVYVP